MHQCGFPPAWKHQLSARGPSKYLLQMLLLLDLFLPNNILMFQALEKTGHLRIARVVNNLDLVTALPTRQCWYFEFLCCCLTCCMAAIQSRKYWHVGVRVLLYADGQCHVSYERRSRNYQEQLEQEFSEKGTICKAAQRLWRTGSCGKHEGDFLKNHSCMEYISRIEAAREHLQVRHLQHIYVRQARQSINAKMKPADCT
jgi:hypothetical protein